jgi:hypothetical protein
MNKIAIPAILVATVMVAGLFAFAPVEQASTVHDTILSGLSGSNEVQMTIPIADNNWGEGYWEYSGEIRIEKHTPGFFQIEKMYLCDTEQSTLTPTTWTYHMTALDNSVHAEDLDAENFVPDLGTVSGFAYDVGPYPVFGFGYGVDEACFDLMNPSSIGGVSEQSIVRLAGEGSSTDPIDDVAIFLTEGERMSEDEDGAYLVVYLKGENITDPDNDIWITHTPLETILDGAEFNRSNVYEQMYDLFTEWSPMQYSLPHEMMYLP